jgi:hypothetical protein
MHVDIRSSVIDLKFYLNLSKDLKWYILMFRLGRCVIWFLKYARLNQNKNS